MANFLVERKAEEQQYDLQQLQKESKQREEVSWEKLCLEEQLQQQLKAKAARLKGHTPPGKWQAWWQALMRPSSGAGGGGNRAAAYPLGVGHARGLPVHNRVFRL
ncbi:MAG: hypothetical protein WDW38_001430 [Sanguina aurantia]